MIVYTTRDFNEMAAKIVLITGANHGIGYETAKAFLQSQNPYHILLGTRSLQKGDEALQNLRAECPNVMNSIELLQIDVASDESITRAFEVVKKGHGRLDTLINNAGKQIVSTLHSGVPVVSV